MQTQSTYKRTEKITRYTISTPLISHKNSHDQHEVFITMRDGRTITVPKTGSYRLHTSGVLEVNLEAATTFYAHGEWFKIKDTNLTKYLKHFQEAAQTATVDNISFS
jgi:hypothetical protein